MPPKLVRLHVENFRLLETLDFEPAQAVSVLLGANNSGKSNVIDALAFLKDARNNGHNGALTVRHGFDRVVARHDTSRTAKIVIALEEGADVAFEIQAGQLIVSTKDQGWSFSGSNPVAPGHGGMESYEEFVSNLVHVDPFRNVSTQTSIDARTMIQPTGADLATILHYHYTSERERFDAYEDAVKSVLTEVDIIETPIMSSAQTTAWLRFKGDNLKYDLWQVSSGVKDVLVLVAALHFSAQGSLIILEEPENHLHPTAQRALAALIRRTAEEEGKQIILTTHSETITRQFDDESIWYVEKKGGRATLTRFADSELRDVWDQLGFEPETFLEVLGNARQVLVIVEGRVDMAGLGPLWRTFDVADAVITRRSDGGGSADIATHARALQDGFDRFGLPVRVFVLLDSDGRRDEKLRALANAGFDETNSHVWIEDEIESYLIIAPALAAISGRALEHVSTVIDATAGIGKARLNRILVELGIAATPANTIVQNALSNDPTSVPDELREVARRVRRLLKLNDLEAL